VPYFTLTSTCINDFKINPRGQYHLHIVEKTKYISAKQFGAISFTSKFFIKLHPNLPVHTTKSFAKLLLSAQYNYATRVTVNLLPQKLLMKWQWNYPQGSISPANLHKAFTRRDPKSVKRQSSYQCFLHFWDLGMQKLLVKHW